MVKLNDLGRRADLQIGSMLVSPSRRLIQGPEGTANLEPLVMQVFLLLLDAAGKVVTRNDLFEKCWGSAVVGDASLNRTVVKIRRVGARVTPGLFEVETIPRTGYRLTGEILNYLGEEAGSPFGEGESKRGPSRRMVLGGVATAAGMGFGGLWWASSDGTDPRLAARLNQGRRTIIDGWPGTERQAVATLQRATSLDPKNAEAWGLLANALVNASGAEVGERAGTIAQAADSAVRNALSLDPREPHALLAKVALQRGMQDRASTEDELRRILAIAPDNVLVLHSLSQLLHGAGRLREGYALRARALSFEPLSPDYRAREALSLWAIGRTTGADQVSDRNMQLWPSHRVVRMARLLIYAFTGRTRAASAMVEDEEASPALMSGVATSVWRVSLEALEKRTPSTTAAARTAIVEASKTTPSTASHAILILSALGEIDAAFDVANGLLLARGSVLVRPNAGDGARYLNIPGWRNTFGMFMPPTKAMRLDRRFKRLCDELGLTEYWRARGVGPDQFLFKA